MRDLSSLAASSMTVTSQEGGNMVHSNAPALTAPGTAPATPVPSAEAQVNPDLENSAHIPVGTPPGRRPSAGFAATSATWKTVTDG